MNLEWGYDPVRPGWRHTLHGRVETHQVDMGDQPAIWTVLVDGQRTFRKFSSLREAQRWVQDAYDTGYLELEAARLQKG